MRSPPVPAAGAWPPAAAVLFAGNGISLLPFYYAHLGYQATAVDFARPAVDWVREAGERRDIAAWFYEVTYDSPEDGVIRVRMDVPASRARAAEGHVPGGSATFIHADLFDYQPAQPFDAILLRCALERFPGPRRRELMRRLAGWLAAGGICWAAMEGGHPDWAAMQDHLSEFTATGFSPHLSEWHRWSLRCWEQGLVSARDPKLIPHLQESRRRREWEEQDDWQRLRNGERMAVCIAAGEALGAGW